MGTPPFSAARAVVGHASCLLAFLLDVSNLLDSTHLDGLDLLAPLLLRGGLSLLSSTPFEHATNTSHHHLFHLIRASGVFLHAASSAHEIACCLFRSCLTSFRLSWPKNLWRSAMVAKLLLEEHGQNGASSEKEERGARERERENWICVGEKGGKGVLAMTEL